MVRRPGRFARLVAPVLALALLLPAWGSARPHCAAVGSTPVHGAHGHHAPMPDAGTPAAAVADAGETADCPHCPPSQCAQAASCAAATLALPGARAALDLHGGTAVAGPAGSDPPSSRTFQPPTPPPLPVATS